MNLATIHELLNDILATGNLELRLTNIDGAEADLEGIAWSINDLLDRVETFMREADNRFARAASGIAGEQIDPRGFSGTFKDAIENLNRNLRDGDDMRTKEAKTAKKIRHLSQQVADIAQATADNGNTVNQQMRQLEHAA